MPEGDTLHRTAATLHRALSGAHLVAVEGTHPALRRTALGGRAVEGVRSYGKHLVIELEGGTCLLTHLGMPGSWHLYRPGERWRRSPGAARVVLHTQEWVAVCFSAPSVEVLATHALPGRLQRLGPDLLDSDFPEEAFLARARSLPPGTTAAELLLDQRVMAGVGNVYKSEVLFLEHIHPSATGLGEDRLLALARRARRLLAANRSGGWRSTTGDPRPGGDLWVYGRAGLPCRRCHAPIAAEWLGRPPRVTYWCPACQPSSRSISKV